MGKLPDPKTLADSIADGVLEVAEGPVRIADNVATVAEIYAKELRSGMDDVRRRMPDDPSVVPDFMLRTAGQTVRAGLGLFEGFGKGIMDTFAGVKTQIKRVTG